MNTRLGRSSPLTQSQVLMWAGQTFDPDAPHYNMVLTFDINGEINAASFQTAFQALVNESDAMRTVFHVSDGIPGQQVLHDFNYLVEVLDWRGSGKSSDDISDWVLTRSEASFDLGHCSFDSVLIRLSDNRFIWYLNQHHLTTDAWAVSVLYRRMVELYKGITESQLIGVSLPKFQEYIDYEAVVRGDTGRLAVNDYWTHKISKERALPDFYGHTKFTSTTLSDRFSISLGVELSNRLRELTDEPDLRAWTQHLSLFNLFATVLFAYLYRVSGMHSLAIGTPAHNRITPEFKETPGLFIEIFPLLVELNDVESFGSLHEQVRIEMNNFLKFAQPGASTPDLSRSFNVVLNYIHATFSDFDNIPMNSEWVHPGHCDPGHYLRLQVYDFDVSGNIQLHFDLNNNAFIEDIKGFVSGHFLKLLNAFVEDRSQSIEQPSLLSKTELEGSDKILSEPISGREEELTIIELFNRQVELSSDLAAIKFEGEIVNYRQLDELSNKIAHYLQKLDIKPGSRVALYLKRSPDFIACVLGVLKAGAAFVPIAYNYPTARVQYMLSDSQATVLITTEDLGKGLNLNIPAIRIDADREKLEQSKKINPEVEVQHEGLAYIMYTSGSTGRPKGVMISHRALHNYIRWACSTYLTIDKADMPFFTMTGFDLTITSLFLPIVAGGTLHVYPEEDSSVDLTILKVIEANEVNIIKLTPSHLALLKEMDMSDSRIKTIIVGGEAFTSELGEQIYSLFGSRAVIFNEYGPTEATVGCTFHKYDAHETYGATVPIGQPVADMQVYVLDKCLNQVPKGVVGELYLTGIGLAEGYWNQPDLTQQKFINNPLTPDTKMYRTGDMGRINESNFLECLGRMDDQVKIAGIRIELGEIESTLSQIPGIDDCAVVASRQGHSETQQPSSHCTRCGLPSNYPNATFNDSGVCHLCSAFESYEIKAKQYFKTLDDLRALFNNQAPHNLSDYDCMMLLSGGKDSTYALAQLVEMDLCVLAFTLDNGYISDEAKANIGRVVNELGVDHIYGTTPAMNEIFVDSLKRHSNVCNGCFKVVYTLSSQIALEKGIPYIVTGLSRGQFFETRLTEELFWNDEVDVEGIDQTILDARKAYHRVDDAVYRMMDVSMFDDDRIFEKIKFLDFYRYSDVSLEDMMTFLGNRLPWIRPTDTGRSTNCLINQVGIHVHRKQQGYNNYAFPYSWDVRIGHKTREETLEELNEEIDEVHVTKIMEEIGFDSSTIDSSSEKKLVAYYTGSSDIPFVEIRQQLALTIPDYMVPARFKHLDALPLSPHGKIDRNSLREMNIGHAVATVVYAEPETQVEEMLVIIWQDVLQLPQIGINDNFLDLGGHSLAAIRISARMNEAFHLDLPLSRIFEMPTVSNLAAHIEMTMRALLEE